MKRSMLSGTIASTIAASLLFAFANTAVASQSHKIRQGENLWAIAQKYHTTPAKIARANGISETKLLKLGNKLVIPGKEGSKSHKQVSCSKKGCHVISGGDTLWTIAKRYNTTPEKLARANGLTERSLLQLGDKIVIPGAAKVKNTQHKKQIASTKHKAKKYVATAKPKYKANVAQVNKENTPAKAKLVRTALAYCGTRYASGGTTSRGFDCSGFVRYVYQKYGLHLPHSSAQQATLGKQVSKSELKQGDLVFFHTGRGGISHVGIYIGNGRFVHASSHGRGVTTDSLNDAYYGPRYRGARRVH